MDNNKIVDIFNPAKIRILGDEEYGIGKKYYWPYNPEDARLFFVEGYNYNCLDSFLKFFDFDFEMSFPNQKSISDDIRSNKELIIKSWSYEKIICSAMAFCFQNSTYKQPGVNPASWLDLNEFLF